MFIKITEIKNVDFAEKEKSLHKQLIFHLSAISDKGGSMIYNYNHSIEILRYNIEKTSEKKLSIVGGGTVI